MTYGSAPTKNYPHATLSLSKPAGDTDNTHWEACGRDDGVMTNCHYLTFPSVITTQGSAPLPHFTMYIRSVSFFVSILTYFVHVCPWACTEVGGQSEGLSGLAAGSYPLSHLKGSCEFLTLKEAFLVCTGLGSVELIINKPGKNCVLNEH